MATTRTPSRPRSRRSRSIDATQGRVSGKIKHQFPTRKDVERRARELAVIDERGEHAVNESDRRRAKKELRAPIHPSDPRKDIPPSTDTAQWDPTPASTGKRRRRKLPADDQVTKTLVEEGVDEAEHDEMLSARRNRES